MLTILKRSWQIYRQHFLVILAVVLADWAPIEFFSSYMDVFQILQRQALSPHRILTLPAPFEWL